MSRVRKRRLTWDEPTDEIVGWHVYVNDNNSATPDFLAAVDAGNIGAVAFVDVADGPEWEITGLADSTYDFAVVADDGRGGLSDPLSPEVWQDVPFDGTPPATPTGGAIEFVDD